MSLEASISIGIPYSRSLFHLRRLIKSVSSMPIRSRIAEVIIVGFGEPPDAQFIESCPWPCKFIQAETSQKLNRQRIFSEATQDWIWFLDDDVELATLDEHLFALLESPSRAPALIAGTYWDPPKASLACRVNNQIARLWQSYYRELPLGGNFLLRKASFPYLEQGSDAHLGAEEIALWKFCKKSGLQVVVLPDLNVYHHCQINFFNILLKHWRHESSADAPSEGSFRSLLRAIAQNFSLSLMAIIVLISIKTFCRLYEPFRQKT